VLSLAGKTSSSLSSVPVGQVGAWIHIGEDGQVTVYTGKVEVGQKYQDIPDNRSLQKN
jgi:isoquinoline 1-oxidoreductase